ncbi:MAG: DegV family protein [Anaerolineae bacterium]|nr:DegV family protein [Anaerolineae bacterium]
MNIRLVVDSTCDLPEYLIKAHRISVVPLYVYMGNKEYQDGVDLSKEDFYNRLPDVFPFPVTAAPGPGVYLNLYKKLADEGAEQILSLHISQSLSSMINGAYQAAEEFKQAEVTVVDSGQLGLGFGFQVLAAAEAIEAGRTMPEILDLIKDLGKRTFVFAALDTLEYLKRGGRMNGTVSFLGNLLQIKPIMLMHAGVPTSEKVRTRKRALHRLVEIFNSMGPLERVAMVHTHALERAEELLKEVKHLLPETEVLRSEISPVLGAHVGPGVVGFVCVKKAG